MHVELGFAKRITKWIYFIICINYIFFSFLAYGLLVSVIKTGFYAEILLTVVIKQFKTNWLLSQRAKSRSNFITCVRMYALLSLSEVPAIKRFGSPRSSAVSCHRGYTVAWLLLSEACHRVITWVSNGPKIGGSHGSEKYQQWHTRTHIDKVFGFISPWAHDSAHTDRQEIKERERSALCVFPKWPLRIISVSGLFMGLDHLPAYTTNESYSSFHHYMTELQ